jgi:hypothetical protein
MDGPPFDPTGVNWTFIGERLSSSSLGTTPIPSAGVDLHQMGTASEAGMTGLSNSQAMIDSDAMAMWCNAPSGFEYVTSFIAHLVTHSYLQLERVGNIPQ